MTGPVPDPDQHLTDLALSACYGFDVTAYVLDVQAAGMIALGVTHRIRDSWYFGVDDSLGLHRAEQTILHECAHVLLGHPDDPEYEEAKLRDELEGRDFHRGPWEIEANALAAALAEAEQTQLHSSMEEIYDECSRDARRFIP